MCVVTVPYFIPSTAQVIPSAVFVVDTFFVLSGALGAIVFTREVLAAIPHWESRRKILPVLTPSAYFTRLRSSAAGALLSLKLRCCMTASSSRGPSRRVAPFLYAYLMEGDRIDDNHAVKGSVELGRAALNPRERDPSTENGAREIANAITNSDCHQTDERFDDIDATVAKQSMSRTAMILSRMYVELLVHRLLRLAPAVFATLCLLYYILPLLGSGPWWFRVNGLVNLCSDQRFWYTAAFVSV